MKTNNNRRLLLSVAAIAIGGGFAATALADDFIIDDARTTTNGGETLANGDTLTITDTGSIDTIVGGGEGVDVGGTDNVGIFNNGAITTDGGSDEGIDVDDDSTVVNSGSIATDGTSSEGIFGDDRNTVTNSGTILTQGFNSAGIHVDDDNTVINSGSIETTDTGSEGIDVDDDSSVNNSGSIITSGDNAEGILGDDRVNVVNSGSVETGGAFSFGIAVDDDSSIDNSGSVETSGFTAPGILYGNSASVMNSGQITTNGLLSPGIAGRIAQGNNSSVENTGSITTNGDLSPGIFGGLNFFGTGGDDSTYVNSGNILTNGDGSAGISVQDGNTVNNSGNIRTNGAGSDGIVADDENTITNSGKIVSAQGNSFTLGSDNTLNLILPSFLGGVIDLGTDTKVNITTAPSHSVLWDFSTGTMVGGDPMIGGSVPWFYNATTKQFAVFDPTALAGSVNELADMTALLSLVGRGKLNSFAAGGSNLAAYAPMPASASTAAGERIDRAFAHNGSYGADLTDDLMAVAEARPVAPARGVWIAAFSGDVDHEGSDSTLDHTIEQKGVAVGYNWQYGAGLELGIMGGYIVSNLEAESPFVQSYDNESEGWFAGLTGRQRLGIAYVDFAVTGGMLAHDQERFVNDNLAPLGVDYARADYDSWFLAPEAAIAADFATGDGWVLTPSALVRYSAQWLDGYTESGSAANARVGSRNLGVVEGRVEIAAARRFDQAMITGRLGYLARESVGDDDVTISMIGVRRSIGFGNEDVSAPYLGLGAAFELYNGGKLEFDGQAYIGDDLGGLQGALKYTQRF